MKTSCTVVLSIFAGASLGAAAAAAFVPTVEAAQNAAGGHNLHTGGGRVVTIDGAAAPKRVAIIEWDSLEQAQAFFGSAAFRNLAPQRDNAIRFLRAYAVEATSN